MLRRCRPDDRDAILAIVNDGARAYRGVIPGDRWHDPYMPGHELDAEIAAGVAFWGWEDGGTLAGVMGVQPVDDVRLIRHAYVRTDRQRRGIASHLMDHLMAGGDRPTLVGTWAAATWAVAFYRRHGFTLLDADATARLLRRYWTIPERQAETSVVLADGLWMARH